VVGVKAVKVRKVRKEWLENVSVSAPDGASDIACASVTVRVVVDPLVMSSDRTNCDRIDGDGGAEQKI
jgi:hypothetical protein